jgi:hypothetical protein
MAIPEPTDIEMRIDLALEAVAEVTTKVDEIVRVGDEKPSVDEPTKDLYRLVSRLAEGVGEVAMGLRLLERSRS